MKTGIIGLPQVGKTSLFKILTKAKVETPAYSNPREAHLGVAKVPDERLDKLAALYKPKRLSMRRWSTPTSPLWGRKRSRRASHPPA
jgi:ribosome-binding ATPase YchF (GTP1/OBG family)